MNTKRPFEQPLNQRPFLRSTFALLASALRPATYSDGKTPKARNNHNASGATRRGYQHRQGKHFLSISLQGISPAQYRREHRGRVTDMVPNHKKPHAKPRGRNLVKPMKFFGIGGV